MMKECEWEKRALRAEEKHAALLSALRGFYLMVSNASGDSEGFLRLRHTVLSFLADAIRAHEEADGA